MAEYFTWTQSSLPLKSLGSRGWSHSPYIVVSAISAAVTLALPLKATAPVILPHVRPFLVDVIQADPEGGVPAHGRGEQLELVPSPHRGKVSTHLLAVFGRLREVSPRRMDHSDARGGRAVAVQAIPFLRVARDVQVALAAVHLRYEEVRADCLDTVTSGRVVDVAGAVGER